MRVFSLFFQSFEFVIYILSSLSCFIERTIFSYKGNKRHSAHFLSTAEDRGKLLYKEKCALEKMCEDKQQVTRATFEFCN